MTQMSEPEELGICIGCGEPIKAGQVVTPWDGEVGHYNCESPFSLERQPHVDAEPDIQPPMVLLGFPAVYVSLDNIASVITMDQRSK